MGVTRWLSHTGLLQCSPVVELGQISVPREVTCLPCRTEWMMSLVPNVHVALCAHSTLHFLPVTTTKSCVISSICLYLPIKHEPCEIVLWLWR
mmetsp:Transcript_18415/g.51267  ORF Transcript_18415/g.51267 Transcript_18415/m.51267 type:complete len:93 (+) Transcript_18415:416-694(+)